MLKQPKRIHQPKLIAPWKARQIALESACEAYREINAKMAMIIKSRGGRAELDFEEETGLAGPDRPES